MDSMALSLLKMTVPPYRHTAIPHEAIFSAYGRAHDRPGRTDSVGLGLTVSRQLAQMMAAICSTPTTGPGRPSVSAS